MAKASKSAAGRKFVVTLTIKTPVVVTMKYLREEVLACLPSDSWTIRVRSVDVDR